MSKLPTYLRDSSDADWYQKVADDIEAEHGTIEWTDSGPMLGTLNISFRFMYPPIF